MQLGVVGLGRMGSGVAERLLEAGHHVVAHNRSAEKITALMPFGAKPAYTLDEMLEQLAPPRIVWLYLPAGEVTKQYLFDLSDRLDEGDIIIDGGNSSFRETLAMGQYLLQRGIHYIDAGTSGGIGGKEQGYCLMLGGDAGLISDLNPLWEAVAQEGAYRRVGSLGAGHYVKMVHNAIEYGMMQAYAEGIELLSASQYSSELRLEEITSLWQKGSIIRSYLGELLDQALHEDPKLEHIGGFLGHSGEARWAIVEALASEISLPVTTAALFARFNSKRQNTIGQKVIAILRNKFGGHTIQRDL